MGLFDGITDTLFGGTDDSSAKATSKDNAKRQQFVEDQTAQAQGDANRLYGQSRLPLLQGYQAAMDAIGGTTKQQIDTTARGNYFGQEALLAGMPQFQNAILGNAVDNSALQPKILHPERNLSWMFNAQPGVRSGGHAPYQPADIEALRTLQNAGLSGDKIQELFSSKLANDMDFTPGETSNRALAKQAYDAGKITEQQYKMLQQTFSADPSVASGTRWGSAGSADALLNSLGSGISPEYSATLESLFNAIYGGK